MAHATVIPNLTLSYTNLSSNESETQAMPCAGTVFFFVIYGPLWGLVSLFGLIGNTLSFAVLHRYAKSNVANFQLKALAVTDNLFLITAVCVQMYQAMLVSFGLEERLVPVFPYLQTYVWPLTHMAQMLTVWMMVLVAANRYIAVCKPLHAPRLCTKRKLKVQISVMCILIVIYNMPRFFEYRYENVNITLADNTTDIVHENMGLQRYHIYNILYENVSYCLFFFLIPLVTLVVLNTHLIRELKRAQSFRETLTNRTSNEENNVTLVMIIIIVVFIVCQTPGTLNQVLFYMVADEEKAKCAHYNKYFHISNLLVVMNSSVNFIIYCLFRRQFQHDLVDMVLCRKGPRRRPGAQHSLRFNSSFKSTTMGKSTTQESVPLTPSKSEPTGDERTGPHSSNSVKYNGYGHRYSWKRVVDAKRWQYK